MTVTLDGEEVFTALESDAPEYNPWTQVAIDVSAFADGDMHVLRFESTTHGTQQVFTNFFLDEVEITVEAGGCKRDPEWQCDGDVDGDGQVNPVDSGLVQAAFGSADEEDLCNYDLDCDGQINPVDLSELTATAATETHYRRDERPVSTRSGPRLRVTPPPRVVRAFPPQSGWASTGHASLKARVLEVPSCKLSRSGTPRRRLSRT